MKKTKPANKFAYIAVRRTVHTMYDLAHNRYTNQLGWTKVTDSDFILTLLEKSGLIPEQFNKPVLEEVTNAKSTNAHTDTKTGE